MATPFPRGFDIDAAAAHLARRDRKLGRWIARIGPLDTSGWREPFHTVDSLARSILYQQLSGKAAATIVGRLELALGSTTLTPDAFARVDDAALRACGVSGNKALALRDLSRRAVSGEVPDSNELLDLHHDEIIERLTAVRGIGRWTVQMMLMFRLGRPDILPVDDLGVRKGAQVLDRMDVMPTPKELAARGEAWGPYRTLAGLYLWRIADALPIVRSAVAPKKEASKQPAAKNAAARKSTAKKVTAKKVAAKKVTAKKVAAKKVAPKQVTAKKVASKKVASKKISSAREPVRRSQG